jgi:Uncharacterized protein conserved in bacteria (DUF2087)
MTPESSALMSEAASLVVKQGVGIGVLSEPARQLALGLVWAGLPRQPMSEPQVNVALKALLADAMQCLDTDHVELRRWLVDAGWMRRDGYGREYQRSSEHDVPERLLVLAATLAPLDLAGWARGQRDRVALQRQQRRQAWLDQQPAQARPAA